VRNALDDSPEAARILQMVDMSADDIIDELLGGLAVSEEEAAQFCDPNWVYPDLLIEGHITVIAAEPNGGKTTLLWNLCPVIIQRGYEVTYINSDISGSDAKKLIPQAKQWGMDFLLPDMGQAVGMGYVVKSLHKMAAAGLRYDNRVFIFDTLKKMMPPNDKGAMRSLFKVLRALSAQGMTLVLLAHTLKYPGEDGLPIFEGVGDIKADTDNLLYLIPSAEPGGGKIISTYPDKVRGQFEKVSFRINPDRTVTPLQTHVDLKAQKAAEACYLRDQDDIEEIHEFLRGGPRKQADIIANVSMGKGRTIKTLRRYRGKQWTEETRNKNAKFYQSLIPHKRFPPVANVQEFIGGQCPPGKQENRETETVAGKNREGEA